MSFEFVVIAKFNQSQFKGLEMGKLTMANDDEYFCGFNHMLRCMILVWKVE
jgi:hypothetical protein